MKKIGIVGWGYWGRNYAKYFDAKVNAQLRIVCDLREEMLQDAKKQYPHIQTTTKVDDVLNGSVDGVIIASPASLHYRLAMPFIEKGIPLLIEKPLASSHGDAKKIAVLARKKHAKILVGHTFLFNNSVRYLKKEIDKGVFGTLNYFEFKRQSYGPIRDDVNVIWDFAPHDVAIVTYLLNGAKPLSVHAHAGSFSRNAKEDIAIIILKYPKNILVNINVAWLYPVKIRTLTVLGDKKMAIFEDTNQSEPIKIYDTSLQYPREHDPSGASFRLGEIHIPRIAVVDPLANQLQHFIRYIEEKEKAIVSASDGAENVRILEAMDESLRKNREIQL